jgi:hypothetical protein
MYKNYVKDSLDMNQYLKIMKDAPKGQKYCNGFCQKYMNEDQFFKTRANCKICFNQIEKARKMIDNNQLTAERFKENPSLVERETVIIPIYRNCNTCNENKTLDNFEAQRKECIECRKHKTKINHQKRFEEFLPAIEAVKKDIPALTKLIRSMSSDVVKLSVTHFKIKHSHNDRKKDILVTKLIDHFKSLLNSYICLGSCGLELDREFSVCDVCKLKRKSSVEEKLLEFEKNLDETVANLTSMTPDDSYKYTKKEVIMIAKKLGVKFYKTQDKPIIMQIIQKHLDDEKEKEKELILKDLGGELNINGIIIKSREDGFVDATSLCKAGGKEFKHWHSLDSTKELIKALEQEEILKDGITTFKSLDISKGRYGGSWIHPDLAVQLAQWLSPVFALQVSRWIRQLALTGTVTIGKEKSSNELLELQKDYKKLEDKHRKLLQKKNYHKFKKGACFYIISDIDGKSKKFKPGFEGVDIDVRMQQHRSTMPGCKLEYLIYSNDADLVEKSVLKRFESKRMFANHEWVYDVDVNYIIKSTRTILDVINIDYTEENTLEDYNEQIIADFEKT